MNGKLTELFAIEITSNIVPYLDQSEWDIIEPVEKIYFKDQDVCIFPHVLTKLLYY